MGIKHERNLRAVAHHAAAVATLMDQGGRRPFGFQTTVPNELLLPRTNVYHKLESIRTQLEEAQKLVETDGDIARRKIRDRILKVDRILEPQKTLLLLA